jgi:hypothetical protein
MQESKGETGPSRARQIVFVHPVPGTPVTRGRRANRVIYYRARNCWLFRRYRRRRADDNVARWGLAGILKSFPALSDSVRLAIAPHRLSTMPAISSRGWKPISANGGGIKSSSSTHRPDNRKDLKGRNSTYAALSFARSSLLNFPVGPGSERLMNV